jgi:hypothetical protein
MTLAKLIATALLIGAVFTFTQANAQDVTEAVYTNLNWSAADSGYNEGALCGFRILETISGVQLPTLPYEENALGNIWPRVDMMNAALVAYSLGYTDAAVDVAICSQIHNGPVHQLLSEHRDTIEDWFEDWLND